MNFNITELQKNIRGSHISIEKHPTEDIFIYGYNKNPISKEKNVWNIYTEQCRGLILDGNGKVIERCFPKFWTFRNHLNKDTILLSENKIVKLPNEKPRIYEKLDGTMGILYWIDDTPHIATQRSFTSLKALKASEIIQNKYLEESLKLDRQYSYLFEVLYPENSLVIDYGNREDIILIGVLDKETGRSINDFDNPGFPVKQELSETYNSFESLSDLENLDLPNKEGFVLEYSNGLRIKIKFPWYKTIHKEIDLLINSEFQRAQSIKKLKEFFGFEKKFLTTYELKKSVTANNIENIKNRLLIDHIDSGAFRWIEKEIEKIGKGEDVENNVFDSINEGLFDDKFWNWKERYLNFYYD